MGFGAIIRMNLGCTTTLVVLNLHHFKRDSYIAAWLSSLIISVEGKRVVAVAHLDFV